MPTSRYAKFKQTLIQNPVSSYGILLSIVLLGFISISSCDFQSQPNQSMTSWPMIKDCSLHQQACGSQQAQQSVQLEILPRPIKVARMLDVSVQLSGIDAQKVELDIAGENMYMGYNRVQLSAVPDQPGHYRGQSMLAFCTLNDMKWQISVLITQPDETVLAVPYALSTPPH